METAKVFFKDEGSLNVFSPDYYRCQVYTFCNMNIIMAHWTHFIGMYIYVLSYVRYVLYMSLMSMFCLMWIKYFFHIINQSVNPGYSFEHFGQFFDNPQSPLQWANFKLFNTIWFYEMSRYMRFPTMWYVRPAKPQISLRIRSLIGAIASRLTTLWVLSYCLNIIMEFLSLKEGCTVSSEFTLVKMPHCWKSHARLKW